MKNFLICILLLCCSIHSIGNTEITYQLSTHILDINKGQPAKDIEIVLFQLDESTNQWKEIHNSRTDENGRIANMLPKTKNNNGQYKLHFKTRPYFESQNIKSIYPYIEVIFEIQENAHYHIPITLSANGYSTYRGN